MIPLLAIIVVSVFIALLVEHDGWKPKPNYPRAALTGCIKGMIIGVLVSLFLGVIWGGTKAHYTDVAGQIQIRVINDSPTMNFKDVRGHEYSISTQDVAGWVCDKPQVITYTATEPSPWWSIFPGAASDETAKRTSLCLSAN